MCCICLKLCYGCVHLVSLIFMLHRTYFAIAIHHKIKIKKWNGFFFSTLTHAHHVKLHINMHSDIIQNVFLYYLACFKFSLLCHKSGTQLQRTTHVATRKQLCVDTRRHCTRPPIMATVPLAQASLRHSQALPSRE